MIKYVALALSLASASALASSTLASMENIPDSETNSKKGFHGQIGLGVASLPEYMGGDDTETRALPLINVSYNDTFYFKFNRLGAWLLKSDNGFRFGGVVSHHAGWDSDDGDLLVGLEDRDASIMAGVNAAYSKGMFSSEIGYVTDVSDSSDGAKFYAQAGYTVLATPQYTLTLSAKVEALDKDMVEYYHLTKESTVNATLSVIGTYKLSKKWTLMGLVSATSLGDEIADSPISEDDTHNMALIGATYSF